MSTSLSLCIINHSSGYHQAVYEYLFKENSLLRTPLFTSFAFSKDVFSLASVILYLPQFQLTRLSLL